MKPYIFRDVFSGRIFKASANSSAEAKLKIATQKNIRHGDLARVKPKEKVVTGR